MPGIGAIVGGAVAIGQGVINYDLQQAEFDRQKREAEIAGRQIDYREQYLEDVYGLQQERFDLSADRAETGYRFGLEEIGLKEKGLGVAERQIGVEESRLGVAEGRLDIAGQRLDVSKRQIEIEDIKSQISTAFQQQKLTEARSLAGKRARLEAEELASTASFQGRGAMFRAGIAQGVGEVSSVESQLVVNSTLGLLSREQTEQRLQDVRLQRQDIGKQREDIGLQRQGLGLRREEIGIAREGLGLDRRRLQSDYQFSMSELGLERESAERTYRYEQGNLDFEREKVESDRQYAEEGSEAGGIFGDVFETVSKVASFQSDAFGGDSLPRSGGMQSPF